MRDLDDETVMTAFLLESLEDGDRERVFMRLAEDEEFFERMQALEHEIILRWHRGTLPPRERDLFVRAYDTPARQARVEEALTLIRAFEAARPAAAAATVAAPPETATAEAGGFFASSSRWLTAPWPLPRYALLSAFALVAAAGLVALNYGLLGPGGGASGSGQGLVVAVTLRAVGEKGPAAPRGFETIYLPPDVSAIRLTVEPGVESLPDATALRSEVASPDRDGVLTLASPIVSQSKAGAALTYTISAGDLPDGDYVLTIRRTADNAGGEPGVLATQNFRVIRQQNRRR